MTHRELPPPPNGVQPQAGMQVPAIELGNISVRVGPHPANAQLKTLFIGPVVFMLPFDDDARKLIVQGLTGILPVDASDAPR